MVVQQLRCYEATPEVELKPLRQFYDLAGWRLSKTLRVFATNGAYHRSFRIGGKCAKISINL
jgi:hypothetical protein